MAECDWSPYEVRFSRGDVVTVQAFGYTLTHSHASFFRLRSDLHALMDGHVAAFHHLGGVAHGAKYDSQKPVVLRWGGLPAHLQPAFVDFATHYEFSLHACRRGHPDDKAMVERSFLGTWTELP